MKSTGMIRRIDQLGRIVIPKELRKTLDLNENDGMEIFTTDDKIILRKYVASKACLVTGEVLEENIEYAPGLILSQRGAMTLLDEMKKIII